MQRHDGSPSHASRARAKRCVKSGKSFENKSMVAAGRDFSVSRFKKHRKRAVSSVENRRWGLANDAIDFFLPNEAKDLGIKSLTA
ncbi:hypothetical protein RB623_01670 [Mesorhizobium sp. LHD-90]|uniref:hypothetical protein n=1 Tax=Mesorhizobium sp. LHD-90 TaxID=3071414 RepID=UPI0027E09986|nr:hypothetical protein [Mesorhizobium sp. LHD-90]MDQ6432758.1 hypothetical protein [Mesorhizobium sp. LHD-90]